MKLIILFAIVSVCSAAPQFIIHERTAYAHPAVVLNSALEEGLPSALRNDFYKDPRIVDGLAKASRLTDKEAQVLDREADRIPRQKIYDVLHNAGVVRR